MGRGDKRHSQKMRRRQRQTKKKNRVKKAGQEGKSAG